MIKLFALAALALAGVSCGEKTPSEEEVASKLDFSQNELTLFVGEEVALPVTYQKFERGVYVKSEYDFVSNPDEVNVKSSDEKIVLVLDGGKIKAVSEGSAIIRMTSSKIFIKNNLSVTVKKQGGPSTTFSQDLSQPLTSDMIFQPAGASMMQGLDIDMRGVSYMSWETSLGMKVCAYNKDGSVIGSEMLLPSGGHGDGFCIEQNCPEVYFWTSGTLGDHADNGGYSGGKANASDIRLICRHKFVSGGTQYAEEAEACFYLNDNGCRIVDVDTEHDVMACWTYESGSDYIYVYRFSEIRKAGIKKLKVSRTGHNAGKTVSAYDLNTITPLARFPWKRKGVTTGETNSGAVQGFCVYDDKIYVESGAKNDEATLVSVMDFKGNILKQLVKLGVTVDKQQLIKLNLSTDGAFEPEGMHIRNGEMYLGFVGTKSHTCILKLK